jgi:hypothetical protein
MRVSVVISVYTGPFCMGKWASMGFGIGAVSEPDLWMPKDEWTCLIFSFLLNVKLLRL